MSLENIFESQLDLALILLPRSLKTPPSSDQTKSLEPWAGRLAVFFAVNSSQNIWVKLQRNRSVTISKDIATDNKKIFLLNPLGELFYMPV